MVYILPQELSCSSVIWQNIDHFFSFLYLSTEIQFLPYILNWTKNSYFIYRRQINIRDKILVLYRINWTYFVLCRKNRTYRMANTPVLGAKQYANKYAKHWQMLVWNSMEHYCKIDTITNSVGQRVT